MGETPTLLTCGICGGESRPIHHLTDCIDVLRARADAAEAALAKFRMVNPARADLIEALADANARAEKAEEWRHAGNALVTQLRADLAAARRECEGLRTLLSGARPWVHQLYRMQDCHAETASEANKILRVLRRIDAALAAANARAEKESAALSRAAKECVDLQEALAAARREADAVSHTRGAMMGGACHGCGCPRNWSLNGHVQAFCWRCEEAFHGSRAALAAPADGEEGT